MEKSDWKIRAATNADYEAVCDMYRQLDAYHIELHPEYFQRYPQPPRGWEDYASAISDPTRILLVADNGENLLGFAAMLISHTSRLPVFRPIRFALLDNFFICDDYRGSGLAEDLFDAARDWSLSQGVSQMRLKAYDKNERAIHFYERLGFKPLTHDYVLDISIEQSLKE